MTIVAAFSKRLNGKLEKGDSLSDRIANNALQRQRPPAGVSNNYILGVGGRLALDFAQP